MHPPVPSAPAPLAALGPAAAGGAQSTSCHQIGNKFRHYGPGPNCEQIQKIFSVTEMSQGKRITVRRRCSSCSSCFDTMRGIMRLRKQCSPRNRIGLPSQSAAASSVQMSFFCGEEHEGYRPPPFPPSGRRGGGLRPRDVGYCWVAFWGLAH